MSIWDDISKKVSDTANFTVKKTGELTDSAKLSLEIKKREVKLDKLYKKLGIICYKSKMSEDEGLNSEMITELVVAIEGELIAISRLKARLLRLNNKNICINCAAELKKNMKFCPYCGTEQVIPVENCECTDCDESCDNSTTDVDTKDIEDCIDSDNND